MTHAHQIFEHRFMSVGALLAANLQPRADWRLLNDDGTTRLRGHVDSAGDLVPNPFANLDTLTGTDLGDSALWSQTIGSGGASYSSSGVTLTANDTNNIVQVELQSGYTAKSSRAWVAAIQLDTVTSVATRFFASAGWVNTYEADFSGVGLYYNGTQWRASVCSYNHNGGTPAYNFNQGVTDMASYIGTAARYSGHLLYFDGVGVNARGYPRLSVYEADDSLLVHNALGSLSAAYLSMAADAPFAFRVEVPAGGAEVLTATLSLLELPHTCNMRVPV